MDDRALRGAVYALRGMDKQVKAEIGKGTRNKLTPLFRRAVEQRAARHPLPKQAGKAHKTAAVRVSQAGRGTLNAYTRGPLSGGLNPGGGDWPFVEFGSLKAHGQRGQLARWRKGGHVFFPTVKVWAPAAARVWVGGITSAVKTNPALQAGDT